MGGGGGTGPTACCRVLPLSLALLVASLPLPDASAGLGVRPGLPGPLRCGRPRGLGLRLAGGFESVDSEEANQPYSYREPTPTPEPGSSAEWDEISFPPDHEAAAAEGCTIHPDVPNPLDELPDSWDKGTVTKLQAEGLPLANWSADYDARHPPREPVRSDRKRARTEELEEEAGSEGANEWTSDDDPDAQPAEDLREACYRADEAAALPLARSIAKVDYPSATNLTALHAACVGGSLTLVRALLERGARVNARDYVNHSALHLAAGGGFVDIVEELVGRGADIHAQTLLGETARDCARKTAKFCANETGFLSIHYGYNLTKAAECRRVDALLDGLGVRVRNNSAHPMDRIKAMMSQWDPVEMGYWTEEDGEEAGGEDDTPMMNASELHNSWDLLYNHSAAEVFKRQEDAQDDSWDTSGNALKLPIEGPAGAAWRDPWGHDIHWWVRRHRAIDLREAKAGERRWDEQVDDGQEESVDAGDLEYREDPGPWWDETNAEHEDRLLWTKWLKETEKLQDRMEAGETEEAISLEAIAKGPPPLMEPTMQDKMEHWVEKKYWKKKWETEIPKMMEKVVMEEDAPSLGGLRVLPDDW